MMRHHVFIFLIASCCGCLPSMSFAQPAPSPGGIATGDLEVETSVAEMHIEQLARYLRIQNYEQYRMDRMEYNRHTDELQQRLENWRKSNRDTTTTRELIRWLNRSLGAESPLVRQSRPAETLPTPRVTTVPPAEIPPLKSRDTAGPDKLPESPNSPPSIPLKLPSTPAPPAELSAPRLSTTLNPATGEPNPASSLFGGLSSTIDDLSQRINQVTPLTNLPSSVPPPVMLPALADVPDAPPFVSPAFVPKTMPDLNIEVPKIGGLAELRSSTERTSAPTATGIGTRGRVNLTEVAALSRSYNGSLKNLETKLSKSSRWTASELEPLVDQLEELDRRRVDLNLYESALPAEERSLLLSLNSQDEAIRLLSKRIAEVRSGLTTSGGSAAEASTQRELALLEGFSRKLAELAAKNPKN